MDSTPASPAPSTSFPRWIAGSIRAGLAEIDGTPQQLLGASPAAFDLVDVKPVAGSPNDLAVDTIAVYKNVASDKGLSIGDRVPVKFKDTGLQHLPVARSTARTTRRATG